MPGGNVLAKVAAIDDLGVLQEERTTAPGTIDSMEAKLRSEIFEKERANDKVRRCLLIHCSTVFVNYREWTSQLQDQIISLQTQLAQRPPLSTIQELQNEKSALELILQVHISQFIRTNPLAHCFSGNTTRERKDDDPARKGPESAANVGE